MCNENIWQEQQCSYHENKVDIIADSMHIIPQVNCLLRTHGKAWSDSMFSVKEAFKWKQNPVHIIGGLPILRELAGKCWAIGFLTTRKSLSRRPVDLMLNFCNNCAAIYKKKAKSMVTIFLMWTKIDKNNSSLCYQRNTNTSYNRTSPTILV